VTFWLGRVGNGDRQLGASRNGRRDGSALQGLEPRTGVATVTTKRAPYLALVENMFMVSLLVRLRLSSGRSSSRLNQASRWPAQNIEGRFGLCRTDLQCRVRREIPQRTTAECHGF
jgi:hypothetical protein